MQRLWLVMMVAAGAWGASCPAFAQEQYRGKDPNLGHFYMGRQEVQIMDDAPQVNDMRTNPASKDNKAPMNHAQPLPRASFMPYSQSIPSMRGSLPQTFNGVPKAAPPAGASVDPKSAKAGKYKGGKSAPASGLASSAPQSMKKYAPVAGYGSGTHSVSSTSAGSGENSSTHVQGSLLNKGSSALHWSRTRPQN